MTRTLAGMCARCGNDRLIHARQMCNSCYSAATRRPKEDAMARKTPLIAACIDCTRTMVIKARGRCATCDEHWRKYSGAYVPVRRRVGDRQWANEQTRQAWAAQTDAEMVTLIAAFTAGPLRALADAATWAEAEALMGAHTRKETP